MCFLLQAIEILTRCKQMLAAGEVPTCQQMLQQASMPSAASWVSSAVRQRSDTQTPSTNRPGLFVQKALAINFDLHPGPHLVSEAIMVLYLERRLQQATAAQEGALAEQLRVRIARRRARARILQQRKLAAEGAKGRATTKLSQQGGALEAAKSKLSDTHLLFVAQLPPVELDHWLEQLSSRGRTVGSKGVTSSTAGMYWHDGTVTDARAALLVQQHLPQLKELRTLLTEGVTGDKPDLPATVGPGTPLEAAAARDKGMRLLVAAHALAVSLAGTFRTEHIVAMSTFVNFVISECTSHVDSRLVCKGGVEKGGGPCQQTCPQA